ncbi:MAG: glycerol-3-phosphate ABC transporter ATP-binding protein [Myxococcales bacterium]|nr:glycerol-3-phosphate ABC transporter ATP-binding protein [Myxococcales bacterium]
MARVLFEKVTKSYGDVQVVREFNLEIADQEFLVLVGPSGCGKSTTLRMIAGLEEITSGDLFIGERRVNDIAPKDRDIAMVFQNYALYPHMTVFDNMSFALKLRRMPSAQIKRRVEEVAETLGIGELLQRKPKQLSGGQRQRVAMGRAIVRDPKVFLFDEPLSNLDAKLRVQMRVELSRLHTRLKTTMVYVTHDQVEAMTLADRIVVLNGGYIQQVGTPMELYHTPANAFVGGFIGSPSMNFFSADVASEGGRITVTGDGYHLTLGDESAAQLKAHGDLKRVMVGLRPKDISPEAVEDNFIESVVDVIEPMGGETFYYFDVGESQIVGRSEGGVSASVGEVTRFRVDVDNIHLFSEDGETRLN